MTAKLKSEITKITVSDNSYVGTNTVIEPTYINFFFGNNGTGKSTIAKAIERASDIEFKDGRTSGDYELLIFDQDYIDGNMRSYHGLPSVFTLDEENAEIQAQIDQKMEEQTIAKETRSTAITEKGNKEQAKEELIDEFYKFCWNDTADLRSRFTKTQEGKKKTKLFADRVMESEPVQHNLDELKRMYDSAYSDSAKRYIRFPSVDDVNCLDNIENSDIMGKAIVNSSDTRLATFLKEVGSLEWVRQGHDSYQEKAGNKCPYCSQTLPHNYEEELAESFDNQYEEDRSTLSTFYDDYKAAADNLIFRLSTVPSEIYPEVNPKPYEDKLKSVIDSMAINLNLIKDKISEPSRVIELRSLSTELEELNVIVDGINKLIDENNAIVDAGPSKQLECSNAVFEYFAFQLKDKISDYNTSRVNLESEIASQDTIISSQKDLIDQLQNEIRDLNSQTVDTETAMNAINQMLRDSGFQGFKLRPRAEEVINPDGTITREIPIPARNYEVIRTETDNVVDKLSEGEKNFIAFLYFQQQVFGRDAADAEPKDKIVVIDDPVSSMDSAALFIVAAQVRKMIEICRNNADSRDPAVSGNYIKQVFVLTHNAYFHKEVTYAYTDKYEYVSHYLVKKIDNKSVITHCVKDNPEAMSEKINYNPVKNSYAALWEEYNEAQSGVSLMSIIRRILEYYFLQLCGYEGIDIRSRILEENRDAFTHDEAGNEDYTKYELASSMLSYIAVHNSGINDDIHYVVEVMDLDLCKKTFEMIFTCMDQRQHFDMMMRK